jgi:hypothetical protein
MTKWGQDILLEKNGKQRDFSDVSREPATMVMYGQQRTHT